MSGLGRASARQKSVRVKVNGAAYSLRVPVQRTLLEVLREDLGLTGTKHGCELGECGACTVLLDGTPHLSCLTLAVEAEGREVRTIEGVGEGGRLHYVQSAFAELGAVQCGYCTPGMILTSVALLNRNPSPSDSDIRQALSGCICRCSGYAKIVEAVKVAARRMRADSVEAPSRRGGRRR